MSELPYWFTNDDKANPVYCRACKQHIPRSIYSAGHGLCQNCLSRVSSRGQATVDTLGSAPGIPPPTSPNVASSQLVSSASQVARKSPGAATDKARIPGSAVAVLILLVGMAIGAARLYFHF